MVVEMLKSKAVLVVPKLKSSVLVVVVEGPKLKAVSVVVLLLARVEVNNRDTRRRGAGRCIIGAWWDGDGREEGCV